MQNPSVLFTLLLLAILPVFSGCDSKFTAIEFDYPTELTIQTTPFPASGSHTLGETVLNSGLTEELEKRNTSLNLLDELLLKSADITIENDSTANFDAIDKIELWISADGNPEVLIASKNPIPDAQNSISLDVNPTEDLSKYLKANTCTYRIKGSNSAPLAAMNLKASVVWRIKASAK